MKGTKTLAGMLALLLVVSATACGCRASQETDSSAPAGAAAEEAPAQETMEETVMADDALPVFGRMMGEGDDTAAAEYFPSPSPEQDCHPVPEEYGADHFTVAYPAGHRCHSQIRPEGTDGGKSGYMGFYPGW